MVQRNRVVLSGPLVGNETWSTSIQFGGNADGTVVSTQEGLDDWGGVAASAINTIWNSQTNLRAGLSAQASLSAMTFQYFDAANVLQAQHVESLVSPLAGLGALSKPVTNATVLSLRTGRPGASRRGRVYWPALATTIGTDGRNTASAALALAAEWAQFVKQIADSVPGGQPAIYCVYSPTLNALTPVQTVQCGRVPDTQRRRRDALQEEYSSTQYPPI